MAETSCPTRYSPEASGFSLGRSLRYGLGVLAVPLADAARRPGRASYSNRSEVT